MATQTLRPNGTESDDGNWTRTGGSTKHGVLADDSDATYLTGVHSPATPPTLWLAFGSYAIAAGERVARYRVRARGEDANASGPGASVALRRYESVGGSLTLETFEATLTLPGPGSPGDATSGWASTGITDADQQGVIDATGLRLQTAGGESRVYELYLDLDVWARTDAPTVTTDPAGTGGPPPVITDTDVPTIESYTAALNDGSPSLWSRQVRVFRDAVYLAGGFDPATETDVEWEQTDTSLGSVSTDSGNPDTVQVGEPLANSDTYRAYVRYGKNDVAGETLWSEWGHAEFTLNLTLPTAPTVAVTVDQTNGRQTVDVTTAALTHDTLERIRVQRSDDGGTTWGAVRDGMITADPDTGGALAGSTTYTFQDYDAPRDTTLQYRARVTEGITASGTTLTSDWTSSALVTHPNDGRWWLYDVDRWTSVHDGARVTVRPEADVEADVGVFRPLGRTGSSVVVSGTVHGDDGGYTIRATGDGAVDVLDAVARYAGTVLVKSPFGTQKYIRWVSRRVVVDGVPSEPRHVWALGYAEVDDDIGTDG